MRNSLTLTLSALVFLSTSGLSPLEAQQKAPLIPAPSFSKQELAPIEESHVHVNSPAGCGVLLESKLNACDSQLLLDEEKCRISKRKQAKVFGVIRGVQYAFSQCMKIVAQALEECQIDAHDFYYYCIES